MPEKILGHAERPASRLIGRLIAEFHLGLIDDAMAALRDVDERAARIERMIVMIVVIRASAPMHDGRAGLIEPSPAPPGISVNAIAASLHRSFETIRRHVNVLIDAGLVERSTKGVACTARLLHHPAIVRFRRQAHDRLIGLVTDIASFSIELTPTRGAAGYDPAATTAAAIDLFLTSIEYLGPHYDSWLELIVVNAVVAASVRHITYDALLAPRYAGPDTPPPSRLRHFVSVQSLTVSLGVSGSTLRRCLTRAIASGKLEGTPQHVRASDAFLRSVTVNAGANAQAARTAQIFARIAAAGLDFAAPERHFLGDRPAAHQAGQVVRPPRRRRQTPDALLAVENMT